MSHHQVRLVAHRGLHDETAGGARENTLAAVRAAVDAGVTWVEVDVRLTADGEVVLLHDETLERLWHDPRPVAEVALDQLRELGGGARRIPTLASALETLHGTGVTLLIDMDATEPADAAASVVRHSDTDTRTAWCGDAHAMARVRQALPDAVIWMPWRDVTPPTAADIRALRPTVINAQHLRVGKDFVAAVHGLGLHVAVWTVDDGAQAAHLARIGVDSITTNAFALVRDAVRAGAVDDDARRAAVVDELARGAAEFIAAARRRGIGAVETKTDPADHVTQVDRSVERYVREVIGAQFPDHAFVGEEYGGEPDAARPCWYLDPVDGTANLANGVPWTSFSLALVENGRPVVGAVHDPVGPATHGIPTGVTVLARAGHGAWRAGHRLLRIPGAARTDPLAGRIVATELAGAVAWDGFHELLDALGRRYCTVRVQGSGTATLAGVALGRGHAAMVHRYSPIDHAAALLIVAEAGGTVLDGEGRENPHPLGGPAIVGADAASAHALWEVWRSVSR